MNIKKSFIINYTNNSSFSNSKTHTFTITSSNSNTHTNQPYKQCVSYKTLANNSWQIRVGVVFDFQMDFIQQKNPSTPPGGLCLSGGNQYFT